MNAIINLMKKMLQFNKLNNYVYMDQTTYS